MKNLKKLLATTCFFLVITLIASSGILAISANTSPSNSTIPNDGIAIIDATTGEIEFISSNKLSLMFGEVSEEEESNMPAAFSPFGIIGNDDRTIVSQPYNNNPYKAIGMLQYTGGKATCVAFANNAFITSAHCIVKNGTAVALSSVRIRLGYDSRDNTQFKDITVAPYKYIIPAAYLNNPSTENDWCIIYYSNSITTYYMGWTTTASTSESYTLTGYDNTYQEKCSGKITSISDATVYHNMDTDKGQSGSPIYNSSNQIKS